MKNLSFLLLIFSLSPISYSKISKKEKNTAIVNKKNTVEIKENIRLHPKTLKKLKKFLDILNKKPILSKEYVKSITFLESHVYNNAHSNTLELLANTYKKNGDHLNQIKVLTLLVTDYPKNTRFHYKLGVAYKELFLKNLKKENKEKSIDYLSDSIKINRKYEVAYIELLPLLLNKDSHTKDSLSLVIEMIRYFKKPEYYIYLCEAYFDNKYLKQSQKTCKKAMKKNPEDSKSQILYVLSQEASQNRHKTVAKIANQYKQSFYIQFKAGLFFIETNPVLATLYFNQALKMNPESLKLLQIMSKFLFKQGQFKKSYNHFLKACILSKGTFLLEFQKAASQVVHKAEKLEPLFKNGIKKCFNSLKPRKT